MNKEQYLINKGKIPDPKFGVLHIVHSTRKGTELFTQMVWDIGKGNTQTFPIQLESKRYYMKDIYPYEIDIYEGQTYGENHGHGSGVGDVWSWSYFAFLNINDAKIKYEEEKVRIAETYK